VISVHEAKPLELARKIGKSLLGDRGGETFIELELAYTTRLLPHFTDNPTLRIRQNLFLYWPPSYVKSTLINLFAETIPQSHPVVDVTATSREVLFGSFDKDQKTIVRPILVGKSFATITEYMSFLGSGEAMRDKVNTMNKVLEGEWVTRHLVKLYYPGFTQSEINNLKQQGIHYDPINCELKYRPDVVVLAASRPLNNRIYTYLKGAGHLGRYHIIQIDFSDEDIERLIRGDFKLDSQALMQLKELNLQLSQIAEKGLTLNYPNNDLLKPVWDALFDSAKELIKEAEGRVKLNEVVDYRTKGDIIREITAHAFIRDPRNFHYTEEDINFIIKRIDHFIEPKVFPLIAEDYTPRRQRKIDIIVEKIDSILSNRPLTRKDLILQIQSKISVGERTIDRAIKKMKEDEKIEIDGDGKYKLRSSA